MKNKKNAVKELKVVVKEMEDKVSYLQARNDHLSMENMRLDTENRIIKEVFNLHFKQGIPSLVKALRQVIKTVGNAI